MVISLVCIHTYTSVSLLWRCAVTQSTGNGLNGTVVDVPSGAEDCIQLIVHLSNIANNNIIKCGTFCLYIKEKTVFVCFSFPKIYFHNEFLQEDPVRFYDLTQRRHVKQNH